MFVFVVENVSKNEVEVAAPCPLNARLVRGQPRREGRLL